MQRTASLRAALAGILLALPLLASGCSPVDDPATRDARDAREYFFTPTFGDLREEMQVAREEGKLGMLLFFEAESCPYCQHMIHKVFSQRSVQDWYAERFLSIAVDIHGDVELTDFDGITLPSKVFSDHRRIFMTPVIAFIDLEGNEIYRHLGMIRTAAELLLLGNYIEGNHHYRMEYKTFAKQRGMEKEDGALMTPAGESE
ncbi:MAG: thioredoxin fold domain-containing protein [Gammaproteobacteria bacterium]|nr:thioredoxin fold domain-containing protein [Gammaproteobacteria bacterium]MDH3431571.1 thioredoxin fold domain-containing protein [Gammaproteobacteria bacterium]